MERPATAQPRSALRKGLGHVSCRPGNRRPAERLLRRDGGERLRPARLHYADNITQTFANAPTITGRDTLLAQMTTLLGKVKSLTHPLINVWQEDDGVVI